MQISGRQVILRDERHEADDEDLFRWLNLEEWQYYDDPDEPFEPMSREQYEAWLRKPRPASTGGHGRRAIDTPEGRHIGWVNY